MGLWAAHFSEIAWVYVFEEWLNGAICGVIGYIFIVTVKYGKATSIYILYAPLLPPGGKKWQ